VATEIQSAPPPAGRSGFWRWLDRRTGIDAALHAALDEPIPGGARWAYIFGSGLLFIFLSQVITGVFLAIYYVPAANDAHISLAYIVKVVSAGSFLRSLHSYGASAAVVLLLLHIIQTFTYGSYKGRRELIWLSGCVLFALMLGMAFTGYLLPWDQRSYFATAVGTNIMGEVPLVGGAIKALLRGGSQMGTLTISRFFVLHVFFIPAGIFLFIGLHVLLFRKAGAAGPIHEDPLAPRLATENFYPRQLVMDLLFALLLVAVLGALSYFFPVPLGPRADPANTTFIPRPEWYYLPAFEWLKFWPGRSGLIGIVIVPGIVIGLFVLTPFLDRRLERHPLRRPVAMGSFGLVLAAVVGLGILSHVQDQRQPAVAAALAVQEQQMRDYMREPFHPMLLGAAPAAAGASAAAPAADILARGQALYTSRACIACHGAGGRGTPLAPALAGIGARMSADQIAAFLRHPSAKAAKTGMPAFTGADADLNALVAYLRSLK